MLIRIRGDKEGIYNYLVYGQKKDRYFSRDELDERLILTGDLDIVNQIIEQMENDGERYFHATLSFKEDYIPEDVLRKISLEFRDFYFKAFNDSELAFYAEAHLPRIKTYKDANDNIIERKPHIHIVVPKFNTFTQQPFDYKELDNIKYVDAFQEDINNKYGLASPKDNKRYKVNENSEYIDRYKGDGFKGKGKDFKIALLKQIVDNNIQGIEKLESYLEGKSYSTKYRIDTKRLGERYLNVITSEGGINLRDYVFREKFLKLPIKTKIEYLEGTGQNSLNEYLLPGLSKPIPQNYLDVLEEWNRIKGYEVKYLRNFSRKQLQEYNQLGEPAKIEYLLSLHDKSQLNNNLYQIEPSSSLEEIIDEYRRIIDNNITAASNAAAANGVSVRRIEELISGSSRAQVGSISRRQRNEITRRYAAHIERSGGSERRYTNNIKGSNPGRANPGTNDIESLEYYGSATKDEGRNKNESWTNKIKVYNQELEANVLLELAEKTNGANPEKYRITVASDGSDRIGAGNRNLTNLDFCLKELNLTFNDSIKLLDNALNMQMEINREPGYSIKNKAYLHAEYKEWFKQYKLERAESLSTNKTEINTLREEIKGRIKEKIALIKHDKNIPYHRKQYLVRAARFEQTAELNAAVKTLQQNARDIRQKYNLEMQQAYRIFLMRKARREHDEVALRELRRLRINFEYSVDSMAIQYKARYDEFKLELHYDIDKDGVLHYKVKGETVIKDHGARVEVVKSKDEYIELTLKLAMQKYGNSLELRGKESFRRQCVDFAIRKGYKITFLDEFSRNYYISVIDAFNEKNKRLANDASWLIVDKPTKLIVKEIEKEQLLLDGRLQPTKVIKVTDPDTKQEYRLTNHKINFFTNKVEPGDILTFKVDSDTQEISLNFANEQKIKNSIRTEILNERKAKFINELRVHYKVAEFKSQYYGTLIKTGKNKKTGGWILIKGQDNKFIKLDNDKLYENFKNVKAGTKASIIIPREESIVQESKERKLIVEVPQKSLKELLSENQTYPLSNFGSVVKITDFKYSNGKEGIRLAVKDAITGKTGVIFLNNKQELKSNNFIEYKRVGWNRYDIKINDILGQEVAQNYTSSKDRSLVIGEVIFSGYKEVRGRKIPCLTINTNDGPVSKYGMAVEELLNANKVNVGDYIALNDTQKTVSKNVSQDIVEVLNLSDNLQEEIKERFDSLKQVVGQEPKSKF